MAGRDGGVVAVERVTPREDVLGAVAVVEELVPDDATAECDCAREFRHLIPRSARLRVRAG